MGKEGKFNSKRGQVWVETILYTLIVFIIITLVISFASPQIEKIRDKAVIDQSVEMLEEISTTIYSIGSPGNKRLLELSIRKGEFLIDSTNDQIVFSIETKVDYSEPDKEIVVGSSNLITEDKGDYNIVKLSTNYSDYNFKYNGEEENKTLSDSSVNYNLLITKEEDSVIDFEVK